MHDIDRTQLEAEFEGIEGLEAEPFEMTEEAMGGDMEAESPFTESQEMELASNLLEMTDEGELDQFLGSIFKKVGGAVGRFVKSPVGQALGGLLKSAAKKALPIVGGALGGVVGGPAGAAIGGQLAQMAGKTFGLELEGLSAEDQEFEVARRYVRLAGAAAKHAALYPQGVSPQAIAKAALTAAARRHAPGLLRTISYSSGVPPYENGWGRSGRWIRRGRKIILFGV